MKQARSGAVVVALALAVSSCGGGGDSIPSLVDDSSETNPPAVTGSDPTEPSVDEPSASAPDIDVSAIIDVDDAAGPGEVRALVRTVDVGSVAHYAGFDIEVERVRFGFDPADFRVAVVDVVLTNNTRTAQGLQTIVEIHSQDVVSRLDRDLTPPVPAGGAAAGSFSRRLDDSFTFDDAILFLGREDRQRVQVPLGAAGELLTREPLVSPGGERGTDGISTVTVDAVTRQWDTADPRGQAPPGRVYLQIDFTIDSTVETVTSDDTIVLVAPDGSALAPVAHSGGPVEIGVPAAQTATFEIDESAEDGYVLRYVERFDRGEVDVPLSFG